MAWTNWLARNPPPTRDEVEGPVLDAWPSDMIRAAKGRMLELLVLTCPRSSRAWHEYMRGRMSPGDMAKVLSRDYWWDRRQAALSVRKAQIP